MRNLKILLSVIVVVIQYFLEVFPIQNSFAVNQLEDTSMSSTNVTIVSHLLPFVPVVAFLLICLIWKKELNYIVNKAISEKNN